MIEVWMKTQLVSDNTCSNVNLYRPVFFFFLKKILQGLTNIGTLTFSFGDTTPQFKISIEQEH